MYKKLLTGLVAFAMAAATLGLTWGAVFAKSASTEENETTPTKTLILVAGKPQFLMVGREGISMPKSGFAGELDLWRIARSQTPVHSSTVRFLDSLLKWSVEGKNNKTDTFVAGRNDIVFDLTKGQEMAYKNGDLAIYRYNQTSHSWSKLSTFAVHMQTGSFRIAAVAPSFGIYALGELK